MKIGDLKKVNGVISRLDEYLTPKDNPLGIEFKFIDLLTDRAIWVDILKLETIEEVTQAEIDSVKPKETFVDVEIEWKKEGGYVRLNSNPVRITKFPVGHVSEGWVLSCYIHKYKGRQIDNYPILWNSDGTKIVNKATHARFVKVGE